jgi:hypothetical protein
MAVTGIPTTCIANIGTGTGGICTTTTTTDMVTGIIMVMAIGIRTILPTTMDGAITGDVIITTMDVIITTVITVITTDKRN